MGHGASTNVKKVTIHNEGIPGVVEPANRTQRSSSDGCIVETLNSSKTKADLLELQRDEYKALLETTNSVLEESEEKANLLEQQLSEVEGTNFEYGDRIADLEQRLKGFETEREAKPLDEAEEHISHLDEQLKDKDEAIKKLEEQIPTLEADMKKLRTKSKKKLKAIQTELAETRQESALKVYSLKDEMKRLEEENTRLIVRLDRACSASKSRQGPARVPSKTSSNQPPENNDDDALDGWEDGRTKLIVELSNQMSAQEELVSDLQKQLADKEATIQDLLLQVSSGSCSRPASGKSRASSAKSDRSQPKGTWGYGGDVTTTTTTSKNNMDDVDSDYKWAVEDEEETYEKRDKLSSREGSRKKPPIGTQNKLRDTYTVGGLEAVVSKHDNRTNHNHKKSSRKSSAGSHNRKLKDTYTVGELETSVLNKSPRVTSADSGMSRTSNSDVEKTRKTSSAGSRTSSSRQRRRLQGIIQESAKLSPGRDGADSALSNTSVLSATRTRSGKDSGIDLSSNHVLDGGSASQHSLLSQDLY